MCVSPFWTKGMDNWHKITVIGRHSSIHINLVMYFLTNISQTILFTEMYVWITEYEQKRNSAVLLFVFLQWGVVSVFPSIDILNFSQVRRSNYLLKRLCQDFGNWIQTPAEWLYVLYITINKLTRCQLKCQLYSAFKNLSFTIQFVLSTQGSDAMKHVMRQVNSIVI